MKNNKGSVTVLSLMLLSILTVISIGAHYSTKTEIDIVRNESSYIQNIYNAEGNASECAQLIDSRADVDLRYKTSAGKPSWLFYNEPNVGGIQYDIPGNNVKGSEITSDEIFEDSNWSAGQRFMVVQTEMGESSDMSKKFQTRTYSIYSRSNIGGRSVIVELGMRREIQMYDD